jgi:hypothetical protein
LLYTFVALRTRPPSKLAAPLTFSFILQSECLN